MKPPCQKRKLIINGRFLTQKKTGVQRFAHEIVTLLLQKDFDITIVMPNDEVFVGYHIHGWPIKKAGFLNGHLWEQFSLPLYLLLTKKRRQKRVLINFCNTSPILFWNKISTIHDLAVILHAEWFDQRFKILYKILLPRIIRTSKLLITVSNFSKEQIESVYPRSIGKIVVINNGFSQSKIHFFEEQNGFFSAFNIRKDNYILAVSSIEPRKNFNRLIEAFNRLKNKNVKLVVVGEKGKAFNNVDINAASKNVIMAGYVNEEVLSILYKNAVCFVYPSLYEGFGLPPIEAMFNNCPVIVSDIPSLREVVSDSAIYVNPYDVNDIADKMELLLSDAALREKFKIKGFNRAILFDWDSSVNKLENSLNQLFLKKPLNEIV